MYRYRYTLVYIYRVNSYVLTSSQVRQLYELYFVPFCRGASCPATCQLASFNNRSSEVRDNAICTDTMVFDTVRAIYRTPLSGSMYRWIDTPDLPDC